MYPLTYNFKRIALANKVTVRDASGNILLYAHQKMLKLKEKILIYSDDTQSNLLGELNADRVIDFSPLLVYTTINGEVRFGVKRKGRQSIWRAHYEIIDTQEQVMFTINEANAWAKVGNALFTEIPIVGMFAGYVFNPRYTVTDTNGTVVGVIEKQPSLLESSYSFSCLNPDQTDPHQILPVAIFAVLTRERMRG